MSIGPSTYGGSLLRRLGISLVTDDPAEPYPAVDLEAVGAGAPDLVLVPSEPYEFTRPHLDELAAALPDAEIRRVDGRDLFWWGIRTPGAIARLASVLADAGG